jgi:uncharacterized membrane protein
VTLQANRATIRRPYLDWLRGVAVLIMIEGHSRDSWTRLTDRDRDAYQWLNITAGFGAPIFLFLAGISLALAAGSRRQKGFTESEVGATALRRALVIFSLAFLFRLQSWVISGGPFPQSLLKVDILNVMGVSMIAAALLWRGGWNPTSRAALFSVTVVIVAMSTPIIRAHPALAILPDPIELYLRPFGGQATFTLLPWSGFLLAGSAVGTWLTSVRDARGERRVAATLAILGGALAAGAYAASFFPPLYQDVSFWTTSPAFFFLRLGIVMLLLVSAYWLNLWLRAPRLEEFGRASLFVYWIHVEMAYGVLSYPLHRRLSLEQAIVGFVLFTVTLYGLVKIKARVIDRIWSVRQNGSLSRRIASSAPDTT